MWRDILLIASFLLAGLMYFGLTPKRLAKYAKTATTKVAEGMAQKRTVLCVFGVVTAFGVFAFVHRFNELTFDEMLLFPAMFIFLWYLPLKDFWKSSKRGTKIVNALLLLGYALLIASIILEDEVLWKKIAYSLGGFGVGLGLGRLFDYVSVKLKSRRSLKEAGK